jgi:hypothetical protein
LKSSVFVISSNVASLTLNKTCVFLVIFYLYDSLVLLKYRYLFFLFFLLEILIGVLYMSVFSYIWEIQSLTQYLSATSFIASSPLSPFLSIRFIAFCTILFKIFYILLFNYLIFYYYTICSIILYPLNVIYLSFSR